MIIIFILIGLLIGAIVAEIPGAIIGAGFGLLLGFYFQLKQKLERLVTQHNTLQKNFTTLSQHYQKHQFDINQTQAPKATSEPTEESSLSDPEAKSIKSHPTVTTVRPSESSQPTVVDNNSLKNTNDSTEATLSNVPSALKQESRSKQASRSVKEQQKDPLEKAISALFNFFTTGNPIVKVASIVLFFGVAFLLKYAAENDYFPIHWRFICVAIAAIGLLVWGIRLPVKQRSYALVIQGTAIGILYLTIYASSSLYPLLPLTLAFFLLLLVSIVSAFLAIKQDAPSLAIVAVIGGFLAPILTSSGSNAYIKLFSYYAVLNLGILIISLYRSWRFLCWLGFMFTFVIGSLWGYQSYRPEFFSSTEPFLIFHVLLYILIPILFLRLKKLPSLPFVQSTIVFGLPTISFVLQLSLVNHLPHGDSWSALGWSIIYYIASGVIYFMQQKSLAQSRILFISYLAIGTTFFSLFLLFLFSRDVTSVLWALEAAGLTWIGIRQKEWLPKVAGLLLILLSYMLFIEQSNAQLSTRLFVNNQYISALLITVATAAMGFFYYQIKDSLHFNYEIILPRSMLAISCVFIFTVGFIELHRLALTQYLSIGFLLYSTLLAILYRAIGYKLSWPDLSRLSLLLLPIMVSIIAVTFLHNAYHSPLYDYGYVAYPLAIFIIFTFAKNFLLQALVTDGFYRMIQTTLLVSVSFVLTWAIAVFAKGLSSNGDWYPIIFGLVPAVILLSCFTITSRMNAQTPEYKVLTLGQTLHMLYLILWLIATSFSKLHPDNIHFISVLNPLDITQIFVLFLCIKSYKATWNNGNPYFDSQKVFYIAYVSGFFLITLLVARSYHHISGVPFTFSSLFSEPCFQLTISILWSILAVVIMFFSKKRQSRQLWVLGALLLGAILLKLIAFDMADSGTLARIISFLVVGAIMLGIGYFTPMPPKKDIKD